MKNNNKIVTVRHLHDANALRTYGQDGPLVPGQEARIAKMCARVAKEAAGYERVRILYTQTRRIKNTAEIVEKHLKSQGFEVELVHDARLDVMDQGELNLPPDYQDGEWFDPLDKAWDAICDEAYLGHNLFYRFGDNLGGKYPALAGAFTRVGESMGWSLLNKYSFIADLIEQEDDPATLTLVVAQSDLPLLLIEMEVLCRQGTADPASLPFQCWEVYKTTGLQEAMYDHAAASKGDGNFDIPMGYVGVFDFGLFKEAGFNHILRQAEEILIKEGEEE